MKQIILFFCLIFSLRALNIDVSYGKNENQLFSIITLKNKNSFKCEKINFNIDKNYVQCEIEAIPENGFLPFETNFFKISYQMEQKKFILSIHPKKKLQLFYIPDNIQNTNLFLGITKPLSKTWQIVGFENEIPFLNQKSYSGINFPISLDTTKFDYVDEIDIDKKPLVANMGADYTEYLKVKDLMNQRYYKVALKTIDSTFRKFPQTFFSKDLLFYQIKALYALNLFDSVLENAPAWIKAYPSDKNVPEILYIIGNTYTKINFPSEASNFYKRIIDEYPENRFTPLAKMEIAKNLAQESSFGLARIYFSQAYQEAKDLDSVTDIALNWAFFEIETNHPQNARELIGKILQSNPKYFVLHPEKTRSTIAFLTEKKIYDSAAGIARYYFYNTKYDDDLHKKFGFVLGELYEKAKDYDNAHISNLDFIKEYEKLPSAKEVQKRDDAMLFYVSGDDATKLEHYNYLIKKYPNTPQATKAAKLKTQILIKQENFEEALKMKPLLPKDDPIYHQALLGLINKKIKNDKCEEINSYLIQMTDLSGINNKLKAFDCLYSGSLYPQAHEIAKIMLQDKNSPDYVDWLYRDANTLYALGKYQESIMAIQDILTITKNLTQSKYDDILFTLFSNLARLNSKESAKDIYGKLYEKFKDDKRMMQVYYTLLNWEDSLNNSSIIYAKNLLELQKKYGSKDYTPFADFKLIEALTKNNNYQESYEIVKQLVQEKLSPIDLQKAFYLKANIELGLKDNKQALQSLQSCIDISEDSSWKTLCNQNKTLLKD